MAFTEWSLAEWIRFGIPFVGFTALFRYVQAKQKSGEMPPPSRRIGIITGCVCLSLLALITFPALPDLSPVDVALNLIAFAGMVCVFVWQIAKYPGWA